MPVSSIAHRGLLNCVPAQLPASLLFRSFGNGRWLGWPRAQSHSRGLLCGSSSSSSSLPRRVQVQWSGGRHSTAACGRWQWLLGSSSSSSKVRCDLHGSALVSTLVSKSVRSMCSAHVLHLDGIAT